MDMAANRAVIIFAAAIISDLFFKGVDEIHRAFCPGFQALGQGPIFQAELPADEVQFRINLEQEIIGIIAEMHNPFSICAHQPVKHIAMDNQIMTAIDTYMHFAVREFHLSKIHFET